MTKKIKQDKIKEQSRLIIITTILATIFGYYSTLPDNFMVIKITLLVSSVFGFTYIIATASYLKYHENNQVFVYNIPDKLRKISYDMCIDTYGINLIYIIYYFLNKNLNNIYSILIAFGAVLIIAILSIYLSKNDSKH